jgi:lipoprotein-releasing system permease protein
MNERSIHVLPTSVKLICYRQVLGWLIGFGLTSLLASIRFDVGGMVRNDRFFLAWSATHYWVGGMFSLVASGVAAWIPARRAAGANPVDIIRGAA